MGVKTMNMFYFWLWFVICIVSIALEVATSATLVSIWFALGAAFALGALMLNLSFTVQIIVFFAVSILLFFTIRPLFIKSMRGNTVATNADRIISERTTLLKEISQDKLGELKINGLIWNAVSVDEKPINEGALVEILAIEGSKLIVKKIN